MSNSFWGIGLLGSYCENGFNADFNFSSRLFVVGDPRFSDSVVTVILIDVKAESSELMLNVLTRRVLIKIVNR